MSESPFRRGTPEVSPKNVVFSVYAGTDALGEMEHATQIHPAVAPQRGEIVLTKKRVSALSGSDLDVVLRSLGIESLVFTGIAASGVVLSTLREAADLDFILTVLSDGCLEGDPEVHRILMEKVLPRQASVMSAAEWRAQNQCHHQGWVIDAESVGQGRSDVGDLHDIAEKTRHPHRMFARQLTSASRRALASVAGATDVPRSV